MQFQLVFTRLRLLITFHYRFRHCHHQVYKLLEWTNLLLSYHIFCFSFLKIPLDFKVILSYHAFVMHASGLCFCWFLGLSFYSVCGCSGCFRRKGNLLLVAVLPRVEHKVRFTQCNRMLKYNLSVLSVNFIPFMRITHKTDRIT